jgi:Raf kinase inhibitor-like YbhB/YbcL family protein
MERRIAMRRTTSLAALLLLSSAAIFAQAREGARMALTVTSSAFTAGEAIPAQYTCKGTDVSPALEWSGAPAHTASFAIIMDDPDAPGGTFVHWVAWNIPQTTHSLPQGVPKREQLQDGARQGRNSFDKIGYNGPCPPAGQTHRYFFRIYALDSKLELAAGADRDALDAAMKGHVLAQGEYMGTFHK